MTGSERVAAANWLGLILIACLGCGTDALADEASGDPASAAIRFYQRHLSSLRHGNCRFEPSCSQYALEAVHAYGVFEGTARAADRLVRCTQAARRFHRRGSSGRLIDPVGSFSSGPHTLVTPRWLLPEVTKSPWAAVARQTSTTPNDDRSKVSEYLSFASSLVREGDCYRAATEYKRAAHAASNAELHTWTRLRIGRCFFDASEWSLAEPQFLSAAMVATSEREIREASLLAAACEFNLGGFETSEALLGQFIRTEDGSSEEPIAPAGFEVQDSVDGLGAPSSIDAQAFGLLGLSALARGDWSNGHDYFKQGIEADPDGVNARRLTLLAAVSQGDVKLPHKSPGWAATASAVLPGAGQMYSGRTNEGFRHFLFNGLIIYSVARLARDEHYLGSFVLAGLGLPFYVGNVIGARDGAASFNVSKRTEFVIQAIDGAQR